MLGVLHQGEEGEHRQDAGYEREPEYEAERSCRIGLLTALRPAEQRHSEQRAGNGAQGVYRAMKTEGVLARVRTDRLGHDRVAQRTAQAFPELGDDLFRENQWPADGYGDQSLLDGRQRIPKQDEHLAVAEFVSQVT